jgi:hypothetical protein
LAAARNFFLFGVDLVFISPPRAGFGLACGADVFVRVVVSLHAISLPEEIASVWNDDFKDEVRVPALIARRGFQARSSPSMSPGRYYARTSSPKLPIGRESEFRDMNPFSEMAIGSLDFRLSKEVVVNA